MNRDLFQQIVDGQLEDFPKITDYMVAERLIKEYNTPELLSDLIGAILQDDVAIENLEVDIIRITEELIEEVYGEKS